MVDNLFRNYLTNLEGIAINGALPPLNAQETKQLFADLSESAQYYDKTVDNETYSRGEGEGASVKLNRMQQNIEKIGKALSHRKIILYGSLLNDDRKIAEAMYIEFIKTGATDLMKNIRFVYDRQVDPTLNYARPDTAQQLSPLDIKLRDDIIERVKGYNPNAKEGADFFQKVIKHPWVRRAVLGGTTLAGIDVITDGARGHISDAFNRKYGKSGYVLFVNDYAENAGKNIRIKTLVNRMTTAFAYHGMKLDFLTHAKLHDPNGVDPNNKTDLFYDYDNYTGVLGNHPQNESPDNAFQKSVADAKYGLTGVVILNEEQYDRAKAFLGDSKNKDLPGIGLIKLYNYNRFINPTGKRPVVFNDGLTGKPIQNLRLLVMEELEQTNPLLITRFVTRTLPDFSKAIFERQARPERKFER